MATRSRSPVNSIQQGSVAAMSLQRSTEHGYSVQKIHRVSSNFISGNGATKEMGIVCRFGLASSDKPIYNSLAIDSVVIQAFKRDLPTWKPEIKKKRV